jgi:hypothetical protein
MSTNHETGPKGAQTQEPARHVRPIRAHPYEDDLVDGKKAPDNANGDAGAKAADPKSNNFPLIDEIEELMNEFISDFEIDNNLSGKERQRLFGAGVRNFGFIEKAYDIARENPNFMPRNFNTLTMGYNIRDLEDARQLFWVLQQFSNAANELVLMSADECFRDALRVYGNLRELNRSKVPGADVLYHTLLSFFRRRRPHNSDGSEPTQKELERDFMKLIHGHADGDIEIVNEQPRFTGGVRKVVDNVHTGHEAIKETAEAEIDEHK